MDSTEVCVFEQMNHEAGWVYLVSFAPEGSPEIEHLRFGSLLQSQQS